MRLPKFDKYKDVAVLLIRCAFGFRLVYGTADNLFDFGRMEEFSQFLSANGFPLPLVSAFASVIFQFLAGVSWLIGFQVRITSIFMIVNFIIAIFMVHLGDAYLNTAPAIHLLVIAVFLMIFGSGKYSLDFLLTKGRTMKY